MGKKIIAACFCVLLASSSTFVEAFLGGGHHGGDGDLSALLAAGLLTVLLRDGPGLARSSAGGYGHGYGHGAGYGMDSYGLGHGMDAYGLGHGMDAYGHDHSMARYGGGMPYGGPNALLIDLDSPMRHALL